MQFTAAALIVAFLVLGTVRASAQTTVPVRQPKYPLKTSRTLYSDAEIARARENVKKYPAAKAVADGVIRAADEWVDWKDEDLRFLLTSPDVPRAFAVSTAGCPKCGHKINEKGGDYAWLIDPKVPFKIKCPVDGSVYPSNDFEAYYRSGFKDKIGWDTAFVDDGWGWTDPKTGEKSWFVAYYNHWMWHKHLVLGLRALGSAYTITGDKRYAHKAAVMLHRIAEVYPGMDHAKQSRYGQLMAARGIEYRGKVVNNIWEASLAQCLAEAYDATWETIDADAELQHKTRKTGEQIRSFIEANVLEDAIDAYSQGKILGNFGMHQSALVHLALVRQHGETEKWFDGLMNESSSGVQTLGLNYALYDLIYRDGLPSETAPGYNFLWIKKISEYGDLLQRGGRDVFGIPRTKRLYDGVIDQINLGRFTPSVGDSGDVYGNLVGKDAETFQTAYRHFKDPRYAAFLSTMGATGEKTFKTWASLFYPPIGAPAAAKLPVPPPRLLDGYGMAILNDPTDRVSLSMYYGLKHGHGHFDRLSFELFANEKPIMPDLAYPDAMNDFVPGIYTWSKNTISHNTVTVDAQRQVGNAPGEVKLFATSDFARVVDVEAKETYPQCSSYRRAMIMVDAGEGQSYFIDIFTVAGGKQHDYSLHGPPGEFEMIGGEWSEPAKGTLAGENVKLAEIYDDATMSAPDYKGGYATYAGSGFQHLFNVRTHQAGEWVGQWKHEKDPNSMLRIRVLDQPDQKLMLCEAHVSPVKFPQILKYLIARKSGENVSSRFVSVIEPFREKPLIKAAKLLKMKTGEGVAVEVTRADGKVDIIAYDPSGSLKSFAKPTMRTKAHVAVDLLDGSNKTLSNFRAFTTPPDADSTTGVITGTVTAVYPMMSAIGIAIESSQRERWNALAGQVVHFRNDRHRTAHTVARIEEGSRPSSRAGWENLVISFKDDLLIGLAHIDAIEPQAVMTSTALPLAATYDGATICDEMLRFQHPVRKVAGGKITLDSPLPADHPLKAGQKVWLLDVGVGDVVDVPYIKISTSR
jgi:hypothetical protein